MTKKRLNSNKAKPNIKIKDISAFSEISNPNTHAFADEKEPKIKQNKNRKRLSLVQAQQLKIFGIVVFSGTKQSKG